MTQPLSAVIAALETLAPPDLKEAWDNTGLLIDPRAPGEELEVGRALLTIDLSSAVAHEALEVGADLLIAYHPPLFRPTRRLSRRATPALFEVLRAGLAVYSPHTSLDAAPGGLNDWLSSAFGAGERRPLGAPSAPRAGEELKLVTFVPEESLDALRDALCEAGAGRIGGYSRCSFELVGEGTFFGGAGTDPRVGTRGKLERVAEVRLEMVCPAEAVPELARAIQRAHPYEEPAWDLYPLLPRPRKDAGPGRLVTLEAPIDLGSAVDQVKRHLGLEHVRVAASPSHRAGRSIGTIAIAAGSGKGVFDDAPDADLYVTGELGHHDVLLLLERGKSAILCEHSNTERGYLPVLKDRLLRALPGGLELLLARADAEPLSVV